MAGPGLDQVWAVAILAQGVLTQGWRVGYPPTRQLTASGARIWLLKLSPPGFGQGARFGAEKKWPALLGRPGGAIPPTVVTAALARVPNMEAC